MGIKVLYNDGNIFYLCPRPGVFTAEPWKTEYYNGMRLHYDQKGKLTEHISEKGKVPLVAAEGGKQNICVPVQ